MRFDGNFHIGSCRGVESACRGVESACRGVSRGVAGSRAPVAGCRGVSRGLACRGVSRSVIYRLFTLPDVTSAGAKRCSHYCSHRVQVPGQSKTKVVKGVFFRPPSATAADSAAADSAAADSATVDPAIADAHGAASMDDGSQSVGDLVGAAGQGGAPEGTPGKTQLQVLCTSPPELADLGLNRRPLARPPLGLQAPNVSPATDHLAWPRHRAFPSGSPAPAAVSYVEAGPTALAVSPVPMASLCEAEQPNGRFCRCCQRGGWVWWAQSQDLDPPIRNLKKTYIFRDAPAHVLKREHGHGCTRLCTRVRPCI